MGENITLRITWRRLAARVDAVVIHDNKGKKMKIVNKEEVDTWLFEHANVQGHICDGIKGHIQATEPGDPEEDLVNIAYVDRETGERIEVLYV